MRMLETVVLLRAIPDHGLRAGDIGTIVEVYSPSDVEVEFVAPTGRTRALLTLDTKWLRSARETDVMTVRSAAGT